MLESPEEYALMAEAEEALWWYRALHARVLRTLRKRFRSREIEIADLACGTGGLLSYLRAAGYRNLEGVDLSPYALERASARGLTVRAGDLRRLHELFTPSSKDLLICNDALYFLSDEEIRGFFTDAARIAKPEGMLLINLPAFSGFS